MIKLGKILVVAGLLGMAAGAAIFGYFIFVRPRTIPEGGAPVATARMAEDQRSVAVEAPPLAERATIQPRIVFDYSSEHWSTGYVESFSTAANYSVPVRISAADPSGRRFFDETLALTPANSLPETVYDPGANGGTQKHGGPTGKGAYKWRPIKVPPQTKIIVRFEIVDGGPDPDKPMGEQPSRAGGIGNVEIHLYRDAADVRAYRELNAAAPTWGIGVGVLGLAVLTAGIVLHSRKPPTKDQRPPCP